MARLMNVNFLLNMKDFGLILAHLTNMTDLGVHSAHSMPDSGATALVSGYFDLS